MQRWTHKFPAGDLVPPSFASVGLYIRLVSCSWPVISGWRIQNWRTPFPPGRFWRPPWALTQSYCLKRPRRSSQLKLRKATKYQGGTKYANPTLKGGRPGYSQSRLTAEASQHGLCLDDSQFGGKQEVRGKQLSVGWGRQLRQFWSRREELKWGPGEDGDLLTGGSKHWWLQSCSPTSDT